MTTQLASENPHPLHAATTGAAWLAVARRILDDGIVSRYDDLPIREISLVTLTVERPEPNDEIIAHYAEPGRLAWMHANFTGHSPVAALGRAGSYATRLFDYEHSGRNQIAWVIDRLRRDPATRSAAITTFQPHTDTTYIPCVGLLDFWCRAAPSNWSPTPQHRLRCEGIRQPGLARLIAASCRRRTWAARRPFADDRQVGARVRDRARICAWRGYRERRRPFQLKRP